MMDGRVGDGMGDGTDRGGEREEGLDDCWFGERGRACEGCGWRGCWIVFFFRSFFLSFLLSLCIYLRHSPLMNLVCSTYRGVLSISIIVLR